MCFSAPASFIASGGLAVIGVASLSIAKKEDKILAAIPLLFAIQQGLEGIQWLRLNLGSESLLAGYSFLFFALILWPIYVPTLVFILDKKRQVILKWFIFLGIAVSFYFAWFLFTQVLIIQEIKNCINYRFNFPFAYYINVGYLVTIFGPLFLSSYSIFKWFGLIIFILAIISWLLFTFTFTSVWCFFAAITSSMFFIYLKKKSTLSKAP